MKKIICGVLAIALAIFAPPTPARAEAGSQVDVTALEAEVREVFEDFLFRNSEGRWHVNRAAVAAAGADQKEIAVIASNLNKAPSFTNEGGIQPAHRVGSSAWGRCVLNVVVPGASEGLLSGALLSWLNKGRYAQVASYLLRAVGPAALKGGGVGLAATLASAAAWCSTPWAN